jgi:hypothetical protein
VEDDSESLEYLSFINEFYAQFYDFESDQKALEMYVVDFSEQGLVTIKFTKSLMKAVPKVLQEISISVSVYNPKK